MNSNTVSFKKRAEKVFVFILHLSSRSQVARICAGLFFNPFLTERLDSIQTSAFLQESVLQLACFTTSKVYGEIIHEVKHEVKPRVWPGEFSRGFGHASTKARILSASKAAWKERGLVANAPGFDSGETG